MKKRSLKIISWNVNGVRSALKKGLEGFVSRYRPDILCLQETKVAAGDVEIAWPAYQQYWNYARKKGYSGTAVFSREAALKAVLGMGIPKHDQEGRLITLEFPAFYLVNVYVPKSRRDLSRLSYRTREWDADFLRYLKKLEKKKPVLFAGDLNVAHQEMDLANPRSNQQNSGFTPQERQGFENFLRAGFVDVFRVLHPQAAQYTWWSNRPGCRDRNIGWRIDYFLLSRKLLPQVKRCEIMTQIRGSDHCPVLIELQL